MQEKNDEKPSEEELRERLYNLKEKINILEWDNKRMQINPYKKAELDRLKKEAEDLKGKISLDI